MSKVCELFLAVMMAYNLIRPLKMAHAKHVCKSALARSPGR